MEGVLERSFIEKTRIGRAIGAWKVALVVVGAVSSATVFKVAVVPYFLSTVPGIWSSFKATWVSPLYIYIAVNLVIAAIVVSSAFTRRNDNPVVVVVAAADTQKDQNPSGSDRNNNNIVSVSSLDKTNSGSYANNTWESFHILDDVQDDSQPPEIHAADEDEDDVKEETPPPEVDSGGGESSMEETWRTIMAGKGGLMRRSETFAGPAAGAVLERAEVGGGEKRGAKSAGGDGAVWGRKEMKKWETFNDRVSFRRDPSISTEELGRRADAFIKKVNDNMRLQRLESEQRFLEMVNRGL